MAQTYRINLLVNNKEPQRTDIKLCSGDHGMIFDIRVKDFDTTGTTAQIVFHKTDGNVVESSLTGSDGIYTYEILGNEISYPGPVVADVKFRTADSRISTAKFTFTVDSDTLNDTPLESGAYSTSLEEAIQRAIDAAEIAEGAVEGLDGEDGFSPIANVVKVGSVATITITDALGTTTAQIHDGADGTGSGSGDMLKSVYDTTGKNQDVFTYADTKVAKANVVNNGVTTVSDTVLDGRMGKTLQDQLTTLNDNLTNILRSVTGNTGSTSGTLNKIADYPSGKDINNFKLLSCSVTWNDGTKHINRSDLTIILASDGVYCIPSSATPTNRVITVYYM